MNKLKANLIILFLLLLSISTNVFSSNQDNFDVIYYEIDILVDPPSQVIDGSVHVQALALIDGLNQLTLDLQNNMMVSNVTGNAAGFTHANNLVIIDLDRPYNQEEMISITVFYNGVPAEVGSFDPMTFFYSVSGVTVSSESCPFYARYWWPCKDRPDDKPQTMDIKITVPSNLTVASNGALVNVENNDDASKTFHWEVRNPIATYLVAFSASNYQIIRDEYINTRQDTLTIMSFAFQEDYNDALIDFDNIKDMIRILESYYGEYPYMNEKYGIAEYMGYWGGMEYQTLTCVKPYSITGTHAYDDLFVHELAHQWWGDCVSPKDFHHTWISEGFAVFSEALYFGHLEGQEKYNDYMNNENSALNIKGRMYRDNVTDPDEVYGRIVYNKGAWVLHMLRHVVGEDNFWSGLFEYFDRHKYSSAATEDLQHAFETVTGDSLGWFFHQWVYEQNYPVYAYGWQEEPITGNYVIKVFIDQVQTETPLFKMPVDLTLVSENRDTTITVMVEDSSQSFIFAPDDLLTDVIIDKNNWILKEATQFSSPQIRYVSHHVNDSTANDNGLAEPGETVRLVVRLKNWGLTSYRVKVRLSSDDSDLLIPDQTAEVSYLGDEGFDHLATEILTSFTFSVDAQAVGHLSTLKLEITDDSDYTAIDSFDIKIGNPSVLLVDDDEGADYQIYFHQSIYLAKIYNNSWEVSTEGCPSYANVLHNYHTVIWFTGDDRKTSLTSEEQSAIAEFLDNGGNLLLTGQNIGYDLIVDGTPGDSSFFANYLHAELIADSVQATMIIGVPSDPISDRLFLNIDARVGGAGNQTAPSAVGPINGAQTFLKYLPSQSSAGIRFKDETNGCRLVYLPFGYEGIAGPYKDSAENFLNRIFNWFSRETNVKKPASISTPEKYLLEQNYPNPFNPITKIKFHLPKEGFISLSIYNLMGQKIKNLVEKKLPFGIYEKIWDGTNSAGKKVASGIYIYKLKTGSYSCSKKLILTK
ncbi:T9SS type A sorting domain-containing protein [candidate division KSB1 bacterium]|nr:T9SS type A sorting domain-containing protein [candidate division KSB1 bacterium]